MKANEKRGAGSLIRTLRVRTARRTEMQDVTDEIEAAVRDSGCKDGVCHLYVPHTTAGVTITKGTIPPWRRISPRHWTAWFRASRIQRTRKAIRIRTLRQPWWVRRKQYGSLQGSSLSDAGSESSSRNLMARGAASCA